MNDTKKMIDKLNAPVFVDTSIIKEVVNALQLLIDGEITSDEAVKNINKSLKIKIQE